MLAYLSGTVMIGTAISVVSVLAFLQFKAILKRAAGELRVKGEVERMRLMLDSIEDGVIHCDRAGKILFVNRIAERLLDQKTRDLVHTALEKTLMLVSERNRSALKSPFERCIKRCMPMQLDHDTLLITKRGAEFCIEGTVCPIGNLTDGIEGAVLVFRDATEKRELTHHVDFHSTFDPTTSLLNRREFDRRLRLLMDGAAIEGSEHVFCYFDLDLFKVINETAGHMAGDVLLCQLGERLKADIRKNDTFARLGGDEFGVLMERCTLQEAKRVAEAIRCSVESYRFQWADQVHQISVSIGLVPVKADSGTLDELMRRADAACYTAKESGRNQVCIWSAHDPRLEDRQGQLAWIAKIRQAIEENRFVVYYQPIEPIGEAPGDTMHCEILLRYREDNGRIVPPAAFLGAAERYGLSTRIDRWVIHRVLTLLGTNPDLADRIELCGINLSGQSVGDADLLDYIIQLFEKTGVDPTRICFEVTETAAISNMRAGSSFIAALRDLGCRIALDDFGSGLCSFAYLKSLPVDFIKIDGVFIRGMLEDTLDCLMVNSIHEIGRVMGKRTVAEFVENDRILSKLREIGVNFAQGYGIGKPRPLEELIRPRAPFHPPAYLPSVVEAQVGG